MKQILLLLMAGLFMFGSASAQPPKGDAKTGTHYGKKINADNAVSPDLLPDMLKGKDKLEVKLVGKVVDVCQAKGCFLYMATSTGKIYIKTKDDAFFVPLALNGKTIVVQGYASVDKETKDIAVQATGILVM